MIDYRIYRNNNPESDSYGKFYARSVSSETLNIDKLAKHMSNHNTPYSPGMIKGVLIDMVACVKELILDGKSVKIDDLAIFGIGLHCSGAKTLADFNIAKNIYGVRLKARATGELAVNKLKLQTKLRQLSEYTIPSNDDSSEGNN